MMLALEVGAFHIGIEKAEITGDRTVGTIVEVTEGGQRHVRATFDGEIASVIELLAYKARAAEKRVKELEAKQQRISLKPHVYRELVNQLRDTAVKYAGCQQLREQLSRTLQYALVADNAAPIPDVSAVARAALQYIDALPSEVVATLPAMPGFDRDWADEVLALATSPDPKPLTLANETMEVDRLREIAEEDKGSDVTFESSVMARMLLSVALNSDPVAYTDAEELESLEGVDGHSYAHLWPNAHGFGKDIALYTVPQMTPPPVDIPEIPYSWISRVEDMPDPTSERRVCAFTPTEHDDLRYRFVPASLFKTVCSDATHWFYMLPPVGQEEVVGG